MHQDKLSVREITEADFEPLANYWQNADALYLKSMGADKSKLPQRDKFIQMLLEQVKAPYTEKKSYCLIWCVNGLAVGHSNVNRIEYGSHAFMHLHVWNGNNRKGGFGREFVKLSVPYFFSNLKLNKIFCEPYALNPAPNKVLEKAGFNFIKMHVTTPGLINFEQEVNLWELSIEKYLALLQAHELKA